MTKAKTFDRVFYLDNIRYLLVLLVVVLHAACAYSNYLPDWAVNDDNSKFFDGMLRFLGVFLMPGLFFISGYFALPSFKKQNYETWGFIRKKLFRLGIPWLIGVALFSPIYLFIFDYFRIKHFSLWSSFLKNTQGAFSFYTGLINSPYQFHQGHLWFISLLLLFFICFAILHKGKNKLFGPSPEIHKAPSQKSILLTIFLVGLLSALITFFIHGIFVNSINKRPWLIIGSLIQFQPTHVTLYLLNFILGIYAYHKKWFSNGKAPGHFFFWLLLSAALWFCSEKVYVLLFQGFSMKLAAVYVLIQPLLYFSILLTLISFGINHWQSSSKINRTLSNNSYTIYLIHLFFVLVMQLLLQNGWDISIYTKFVLVSFSSILLSIVCSQYAIQKFPKSSVAVMVILFFLFSTII
jgi:glucan biosynthesis protein C